MGTVGCRETAGDDDGIGGHAAESDLARFAIVDPSACADENTHRKNGAALDDHALDDFGSCADEAIVLDDGRPGLQRLEDAADPDAARKVNVAADLRAGPDRRPGVHHAALADVGADIHERRHEHDVAGDVGSGAHDCAGHDACAVGPEARLVIVRVLQRHLVEEAQVACLC